MTFVPVPDYEDYYEINEEGVIYRIEHLSRDRWGNIVTLSRFKMKWTKHSTGYLTVSLTKDGMCKTHRLHILVAKAFISNPDRLPEVNHEDGDKHNPAKNNLKWCTRAYNAEHASKNGLYPDSFRNGGAKLSFEDVARARDLALVGILFHDIASQFNVTPTTISRAIDRVFGKSWRNSLPNLKGRAGRLGREKQLRKLMTEGSVASLTEERGV